MKSFNDGKFFMPKNPLWDDIETPNGETNAYVEIDFLLEQKIEGLWDASRSDAVMYQEARKKLNELMEVVNNILNPIKSVLDVEKVKEED